MQDRFKLRVYDDVYHNGKMVYFDGLVNVRTPLPLMQCTGLKDKNGKLIYEGDIVKDKRSGSIAIIEYDSYAYSLMAHIRGMDDYFPLKDLCYLGQANTPFEVIGNIYENPELLEVSNDH